MKVYGGVDVYIHIFLTSALVGSEWSASHPGRFTTGIHWIGGWVGSRAGLDDLEKKKFLSPPGFELRPLGRPARSQSLYRLSYPGSSSSPSHYFLAYFPFFFPIGATAPILALAYLHETFRFTSVY
jgi:hypothetical protein